MRKHSMAIVVSLFMLFIGCSDYKGEIEKVGAKVFYDSGAQIEYQLEDGYMMAHKEPSYLNLKLKGVDKIFRVSKELGESSGLITIGTEANSETLFFKTTKLNKTATIYCKGKDFGR